MSDILRADDERRRRAIVDSAIANSQSKAELIGHLERTGANDVAESLEGKALLKSRSPWGTLFCGIFGFVATRYGLHLGDTAVTILSGLAVLVGGFAMRVVTHQPISGLVRPGPV